MKHISSILLLLLASLNLWAQEESKPEPAFKMPHTLIKMAPLQFFRNTFELGLESFDYDYKRSANLDLGYRSGSSEWEDAQGYHVEIGYRRYAPAMVYKTRGDHNFYRGLYYGLSVRGEYFEGHTTNNSFNDYGMKVKSLAPGFTLGWQKTLWEAIVLDVYLGGSVRFSKTEYVDGNSTQESFSIFDPRYEGIMPKVGVKIGIAL